MRSGFEGGLWGCDSGPEWDLERAKMLRQESLKTLRREVAKGEGCWCDDVAQAIIDPAGYVSDYGWNEDKLLKAHKLGGGLVSFEVCKKILAELGG